MLWTLSRRIFNRNGRKGSCILFIQKGTYFRVWVSYETFFALDMLYVAINVHVELASMNNIVLASMNNVELASMNDIVLASMNKVELASMNNIVLASMNKVALAGMNNLRCQQCCLAMITMLLQHC